MAKGREVKTNAMRILDKLHIPYETLTYECDEFIDGLETAKKNGVPAELSFKTLVAEGKSREYYVLVIPVADEIDLKKAARVLGEKAVEMIHVKDIQDVTGYIRGGCSPLGMKKHYPTFIQQEAQQYSHIYVSGGRIGSTIKIAPADLASAAGAVFADVTIDPPTA